MKKIRAYFGKIAAAVCALVMAIGLWTLGGCATKTNVLKPDENTVVISVGQNQDGLALLDVMNTLQSEGKLSFSMQNGMIVSINGTQNGANFNPCWMLYTSDEDKANQQWGLFEFEGERLGSAILGAESLIVKEGCLYIWAYQRF